MTHMKAYEMVGRAIWVHDHSVEIIENGMEKKHQKSNIIKQTANDAVHKQKRKRYRMVIESKSVRATVCVVTSYCIIR